MKYQAQRSYVATFKFQALEFVEGEIVELDDDAAEYVERDSPGALVAVRVDNLMEIDGVGKERAAQLRALKILAFAEVVAADVETLSAEMNVTADEVAQWQAQARTLAEPPQDRQVKRAARRRKDREGDPSDAGAMTRNDFRAVINKE